MRLTEENIVDLREKGGDDHDNYSYIVQSPQEHVQVVGVATEEMAHAAGEETEH